MNISQCLENASKFYIKDLTCLEGIKYVHYLEKDKVVAAYKDGCGIINTQTNTQTKNIVNGVLVSYMEADVHNKKIVICSYKKTSKEKISLDGKTIIYNVSTDKVEWTTCACYPHGCFVFNPHNNSVVLRESSTHIFKNYDYVNNKAINIFNADVIRCAIHPRKQIMCILKVNKLLQYDLSHDLSHMKLQKQIEIDYVDDYQMSSGQFFAVTDFRTYMDSICTKISVIDLLSKNENDNDAIIFTLKGHFGKVLFYVDFILAVALRKKIDKCEHWFMLYWNVRIQQLICSVLFLNRDKIIDFSFSPDKKEVVVVFGNNDKSECSLYAVPLKVRYAVEKPPLILVALKKCIAQQNQGLQQQDILKLLLNYYCDVYK